MKKKILFIVNIIILIFMYSNVYANTTVKEAVVGNFKNYDINAEYKIEIKDSKDKKIIITFKNMTIIESYIDIGSEKIDLKPLSRITHSEPNDMYFLYIEFITDSKYQLDYNNQYQYSVYVNNKLKKESKSLIRHIDQTKSDSQNTCYTFQVEYDKMQDSFGQVFGFGVVAYIITYILVFILCIYMKFYGIRHIKSKKYGGIVNENKIDYCRELPKNIDLEVAYTALYYCSKISIKKLKNGIIGAFLLKWSNEDNILITDEGNQVFSIDLKEGNFAKSEMEQELYNMLKVVAGSDNIIDNNELKEWSRINKKTLEQWHKKLLSSTANENLRLEAEALLGLKKFLLDYSLIKEKRHIEVKLWEQYLIYAQLLGISDEVTRQFKKIYPDYSKIGQLSVMNLNQLVVEYIFIRIFMMIPMALALFIAIIFSMLYYIIKVAA